MRGAFRQICSSGIALDDKTYSRQQFRARMFRLRHKKKLMTFGVSAKVQTKKKTYMKNKTFLWSTTLGKDFGVHFGINEDANNKLKIMKLR